MDFSVHAVNLLPTLFNLDMEVFPNLHFVLNTFN
jgi:hypothetical protein